MSVCQGTVSVVLWWLFVEDLVASLPVFLSHPDCELCHVSSRCHSDEELVNVNEHNYYSLILSQLQHQRNYHTAAVTSASSEHDVTAPVAPVLRLYKNSDAHVFAHRGSDVVANRNSRLPRLVKQFLVSRRDSKCSDVTTTQSVSSDVSLPPLDGRCMYTCIYGLL